ncbi:MAG: rRNA adenine N-6-methyltransferase family protein [Terrimicrobiaceae bacterium]
MISDQDVASVRMARHSLTLKFLSGIIHAPLVTGAIAPSSRRLARRMVRASGVEQANAILELGPGTGVITREILDSKRAGATVLAIERRRDFAHALARQYPAVYVVEDCASRLRHHSQRLGLDGADSIVSALPWTNFPPDLQANILGEACAFLREGGVFVTILCAGLHLMPPGRRFRRLLESLFPSVERSDFILRNVPPAFIYRCSK